MPPGHVLGRLLLARGWRLGCPPPSVSVWAHTTVTCMRSPVPTLGGGNPLGQPGLSEGVRPHLDGPTQAPTAGVSHLPPSPSTGCGGESPPCSDPRFTPYLFSLVTFPFLSFFICFFFLFTLSHAYVVVLVCVVSLEFAAPESVESPPGLRLHPTNIVFPCQTCICVEVRWIFAMQSLFCKEAK
jgi:hypothetical protein